MVGFAATAAVTAVALGPAVAVATASQAAAAVATTASASGSVATALGTAGAVGGAVVTGGGAAAAGAAAVPGAVYVATTAAGMGAAEVGVVTGFTTFLASTGPPGWTVLAFVGSDDGLTWDCWKPIVRDTSTTASQGIRLQALQAHKAVKSCSFRDDHISVVNQWEEEFRLDPVRLPSGQLAFHATRCVS